MNILVPEISALGPKLDLINAGLTQIYDRLEHVKVDSFVNVRIMDELGALPVPCTEATGLLVFAYATIIQSNTNLVVEVEGPVDTHNHHLDAFNTGWRPSLGKYLDRLAYTTGSTPHTGSVGGCAPICLSSGIIDQVSPTDTFGYVSTADINPGMADAAFLCVRNI